MTSRDQAIEEAWTELVKRHSRERPERLHEVRKMLLAGKDMFTEFTDLWLAARARLDGAKMMPRVATPATPFEMFCPQCREMVHSEAEACAHGLLPRATPKEGT